ncbi:MAG: SurA N-terminal domain-containing protein [bacterium]
MLSNLRNILNGPFRWVAVALLFLAFAFVGLPSIRGFGGKPALKVGSTKYATSDINKEFNRELARYRSENDAQLSRQEAIQAGLLNRTLNKLTAQAAIRQEADKLGLGASTQMVSDILHADEGFHNPSTGKFDMTALNQILRQNELGVKEFNSILKREIIQAQLANAAGSPTKAPEEFISELMLRQNEVRTISYVTVTADQSAPIPEPTEEELRAFYEERKDSFTSPEYRIFEAVQFRPSDFEEGLDVSEEELKNLFDLRRKQLDTPEKRTIQLIHVDTELEARSIADRLALGADFAEIAREMGFDPEALTYEDRVKGDLLDAATNEAAFAPDIKQGDVFGPVDGLTGWYAGRVVSITDKVEANFEDERDSLRADALKSETSRRLNEALDQIENARDEGASLEEAVEETGIGKIVTIGPVDQNLQVPGGAILEDTPYQMVNEAFILQVGEESDVLNLDEEQGGYFIIALEEIIAPEITPFKEATEQLATSWKDRQLKENIAGAAADIRQQVIDGTALSDVTSKFGLSKETVTVSRTNPQQNIPPSLFENIFKSDLHGVITDTDFNGLRGYVVQVDKAAFQPSLQAEAIIPILRQNQGQQLASELFQAYLDTLEEEIGVTQNDAQLTQTFQLDQLQ